MHNEEGFEDLVLKNTERSAIDRFVDQVEWPQHLLDKYADPKDEPVEALADYFSYKKGTYGIADFLAACSEDEIPDWIKETCLALHAYCMPVSLEQEDADATDDEDFADLV